MQVGQCGGGDLPRLSRAHPTLLSCLCAHSCELSVSLAGTRPRPTAQRISPRPTRQRASRRCMLLRSSNTQRTPWSTVKRSSARQRRLRQATVAASARVRPRRNHAWFCHPQSGHLPLSRTGATSPTSRPLTAPVATIAAGQTASCTAFGDRVPAKVIAERDAREPVAASAPAKPAHIWCKQHQR
jgi:hypothetical protein